MREIKQSRHLTKRNTYLGILRSLLLKLILSLEHALFSFLTRWSRSRSKRGRRESESRLSWTSARPSCLSGCRCTLRNRSSCHPRGHLTTSSTPSSRRSMNLSPRSSSRRRRISSILNSIRRRASRLSLGQSRPISRRLQARDSREDILMKMEARTQW